MIEKTTEFGSGSFSNGDPGGGFPIALTIRTSPGWITGDLRRFRWRANQVKGESIPGEYHIAFKVLQFLRALIGDAGKNLVGLEPSVNISNADQGVPGNRDPSMMLEIPKDVVDGEVQHVFVEWVPLHWDAEFV